MRERPMTTEELFYKIRDILKGKDMIPNILDYGIATGRPDSIRMYEFEMKSNLDYGGSEGIYLDIWIEYFEDGEWCKRGIGTFKTLEDSREAMHDMAGLLADFIIEGTAYINANIDDFTWTGVDVRAYDSSGERLGWGYSCCDMETALAKKDELLERYPKVSIRDNATRKEEVFWKEPQEREAVTDEE